MSFYGSLQYQKHCVTQPIVSSIVVGGIFTGVDVLQRGARFSPQLAVMNMGGIYAYSILQCPLEAVHGRRSAWHNFIAGATIGYIGVSSGFLGIPFVDSYFFMRNPRIPAPVVGATVYGGIGFLLATALAGKRL